MGKLKQLGVKRLMNNEVKKINSKNDKATEIVMGNGEVFSADQIISTCGVVETEELLNLKDSIKTGTEEGKFSIIETISVFEGKPQDYGWDETVIFFNENEHFRYEQPEGSIDLASGVICLPENYQDPANNSLDEARLRITNPANFMLWDKLDEASYLKEKEDCESKMLERALSYLPNGKNQKNHFTDSILLKDTFTPRTIKKYTSHSNGALYGSPVKSRTGSTQLENLYLAGTDQGYIGIVGAMLGGIAVANNRILRSN